MKRKLSTISSIPLEKRILTVRGERVILDSDLAEVYGVTTKALNQAVKRNRDRFPEDFVFELTAKEADELNRSQFVTDSLRSQSVTSKGARGGRRYLPYAFTEHGAIMAANVLKSTRAVQMSVFVVRAFVRMRMTLHEKPYENALVVEFELRGIPFIQQPCYDVLYKKVKVGDCRGGHERVGAGDRPTGLRPLRPDAGRKSPRAGQILIQYER